MKRLSRMFFYSVALIQFAAALALAFNWQPIIQLWPFRYDASYTGADTLQAASAPTADYSFLVLGSIFAAAAASTVWALAAREDGALAGIALDYALIFIPVSIYSFQIAGSNTQIRNFALTGAASAIFGIGLFLWGVRKPYHDPHPTPRPVHIAFVIFVIALVIFGGGLVLKTPNILPWGVSPGMGVLYGWMFLGAGGYFAYGVLRPRWANAAGQLAGFLAYDIVLIVPFLLYFAAVPERWRLNLIIYLIVIVGSGLLAIYYLFFNPATRIIRRASPQTTIQPA